MMDWMVPMGPKVSKVHQENWVQRDPRDLRDPKEPLEIRVTLVQVSREKKERLVLEGRRVSQGPMEWTVQMVLTEWMELRAIPDLREILDHKDPRDLREPRERLVPMEFLEFKEIPVLRDPREKLEPRALLDLKGHRANLERTVVRETRERLDPRVPLDLRETPDLRVLLGILVLTVLMEPEDLLETLAPRVRRERWAHRVTPVNQVYQVAQD